MIPDELAINGGPKVRSAPWPLRRPIGEAEKKAVVELFDRAIASGEAIVYDGPEEAAYCREFSAYLGGGYADAVNSGTAALYVALRALELEPFTEIIVPPTTDPGGVMPVPLLNCIPIPADSAPGSFNTGAAQIEARITPRTSAIVVAHIAGIPVDIDPVVELARSNGLPVVEDCSQSHGALYRGNHVGTFGDVAVFSTMHTKHHSTGPHGALVFTRNEDLYWRVRTYADRGKPRVGVVDWRIHSDTNVACSLNFNLGDLGACIGRVQLAKLPDMLERRRAFALRTAEACRQLKSVRVLTGPIGATSSYWYMLFRIDLQRLRCDKRTFLTAIAGEGLPVEGENVELFMRAPWYKQRAVFGTSGYPWTSDRYTGNPDATLELPNLIAADAEHFSLQIHENLTEREARDLVAALGKVERTFLLE